MARSEWMRYDEHMAIRFFELDADAAEAFTLGDCGYLALALHDITGWQMVTVSDEDEPKAWVHVGILTPSGTIIDIEGEWTPEEWADQWQQCSLTNVEVYEQDADWMRSSVEDEVPLYPITSAAEWAKIVLDTAGLTLVG